MPLKVSAVFPFVPFQTSGQCAGAAAPSGTFYGRLFSLQQLPFVWGMTTRPVRLCFSSFLVNELQDFFFNTPLLHPSTETDSWFLRDLNQLFVKMKVFVALLALCFGVNRCFGATQTGKCPTQHSPCWTDNRRFKDVFPSGSFQVWNSSGGEPVGWLPEGGWRGWSHIRITPMAGKSFPQQDTSINISSHINPP